MSTGKLSFRYQTEKKRALGHPGRRIFCITNSTEYKSIKEAADKLGIRDAQIKLVLKGTKKNINGLEFKYMDL